MMRYPDRRTTRWESSFDQAVETASQRKLAKTLSLLSRVRSWQRRQTEHSLENHDWHSAELLWLEGVVLERARRRAQAGQVWVRLARLFEHRFRRNKTWMLPLCERCAERSLGFAPNWFAAAQRLLATEPEVAFTAAVLSDIARESQHLGTEPAAV